MTTFLKLGDLRVRVRLDEQETTAPEPHTPTLVLCNSLGTDLHLWDPQVPHWRPHFRLVRFDTRGHGQSDAPVGPYTIDDLGQDLLRLLDTLQLSRVHLCGISLGGQVATWLALHHPTRVQRLIVANTGARIASPAPWHQRAAQVRRGGLGPITDEIMTRFFSATFRTNHPDQVAHIAETFRAGSVEGYAACCEALAESDLRPPLEAGQLKTPTLVITSTEDRATPVDNAQWLHDHIPSSKLRVLEGAGHLSNVERPEEFAEEVIRFCRAGSVAPQTTST